MSQYLFELCCSVIEDFYGEFYARIFSQLTHNARFNVNQVAQKTHLPVRQVKAGIAALVQLRLIYHHTTPEGSSTYQANPKSTYNVLRSGRLVELARSQWGDLAAEVIQQATLLGFTTVAELTDKVESRLLHADQQLTNGDTNQVALGDTNTERISATIQTLRDQRFLLNVRSAQFQSDFDAKQDAETHLLASGWTSSQKGKKAQAEFEMDTMHLVNSRQSTSSADHGYVFTGSKRASDEVGESAAKRQRTNGHLGRNLVQSQSIALIAVSYHNIVTHTRDKHLEQIASKILGEREHKVLKTLLLQMPCTEEWSVPVNHQDIDTTIVRDNVNRQRSQNVNGHRMNGATLQNGHGSDSEDDEYFSYADVIRHLNLIAESPLNFVAVTSSGDQCQLSKRVLDEFLQEKEIFRLIGDRVMGDRTLGNHMNAERSKLVALRIVRMLIDKGKMDEKTLQETGLLGAKDLRQLLAELKQKGFVDLQEVPREAQRMATRTIFLWFHDKERVRKVMLENLYKAMSRILQRLKFERQKLASTIEKVERSDVQGSEEVMLSAPELKVLRRWERLEQWLFGELCRLDESVMMLRDL